MREEGLSLGACYLPLDSQCNHAQGIQCGAEDIRLPESIFSSRQQLPKAHALFAPDTPGLVQISTARKRTQLFFPQGQSARLSILPRSLFIYHE